MRRVATFLAVAISLMGLVLRKWALLALLLTLNVISAVDRQMLSVTAPLFIKDLHLSLAQYGLLSGPFFMACYTVATLFFGVLSDRACRPRVIACGLALWSGATALMGTATSFVGAAIARISIGAGEASLGPAAVSLIAHRFGSLERGLAFGIYYMAASLGSGIALLIGATVEPALGWRACFYGAGILGVLFVPVIGLLPDTRSARTPGRHAQGSLANLPIAVRAITRIPALRLVVLIGILADFTLGSESLVMVWIVRDRGAEFHHASLYLGVITLIGGCMGNLFGGWSADRAEARRRGASLYVLGATQLATLPFALALFAGQLAVGGVAFTFCYFGLVLLSLSKYGTLYAALQDLTAVHIKATSAAVFLVCVNLLGTALGAFCAGWVADHTSPHFSLAICALPAALACAPCWVCARCYQRDRERVGMLEMPPAFGS